MTTKELIKELVDAQPDDASFEEIVRALAFDRMIQRGLEDSREGRTLRDEEMKRRILSSRT